MNNVGILSALLAAALTLAARAQPVALVAAAGTNSVAATNVAALNGHWHSLKVVPKPGLPEIHFYNKLNPVWWLENSDEPVPPAWYLPADPHRITKWYFRNPFHNFTFYVIGIADKKSVRSGRYPDVIANPNSGWNFAVSRRKIIFLPFTCYQHGKFEFYFGWHPRGNFGIKLNYSSSNLSQKKKPPATGASEHRS